MTIGWHDNWTNLQVIMLSEKTHKQPKVSPQDSVLYDSISTTLLKWQSYRGGAQIHGCQGLGEGGYDQKGACEEAS